MAALVALPGDLISTLDELLSLLHFLRDALDLGGMLQRVWISGQSPLVMTFSRLVMFTGNPFDGAGIGEGKGFSSLGMVRDYNRLIGLIADTALVVTMMWAFFRLQWSHSLRSQYAVRVMLPRFMLAVVLINFSLPLMQAVIDLNNALCKVIVLSGWSFEPGKLLDLGNDFGTGPGVPLLTSAALLVALFVLALAYFVRYALLVVLAITAPLASLLFVLPETQHYAKEWMSLFVSTLFMQPLQLLILLIGFRLETTTGSSPIRHGFALASIIIAFKVPGALHSASSLGTQATTSAKHSAVKLAKLVVKAV